MTDQDREHLRLLSIFHYVFAGMTALFALFPVFHLVLGLAFALGWIDDPKSDGEELVGWVFIGVAGTLITIGLLLAGLLFRAGRQLARQQSYRFCFAVACVSCILMPFGTILGVFTILVLSRPAVHAAFR